MRSRRAPIARLSSKSSKKSKRQGSSAPQPGPDPDLIRIGRIGGTHGLRGGLKFRPDDPDSTSLASLKRIFIGRDGSPVEYRLAEVARVNPRYMRIMLEGLTDVNAAEKLRGAEVFAARSDLPELAPGEFYYFEAVGCEVRTTDGRIIGHIESAFFSGAHDVWVVKADGAEFLIPVIEDVVRSIDLDARLVMIEPIPGLLE